EATRFGSGLDFGERDHSEESLSIRHGPGVALGVEERQSVGEAIVLGEQMRWSGGGVADYQKILTGPRDFGKMEPVLMLESFVDRLFLQTVGNVKADEVRDHERDDDGVVARHFENHDDGGEGHADDAGE